MGPWLQLKFSCRREKWNFLRTSIHTRLITWTVTVITFSYTRLLTVSRRARAKRSREGVPAFCTIPIIHSVQYIFAILDATNGASWYFVIEGWWTPRSLVVNSNIPYTHRGWWTPRSLHSQIPYTLTVHSQGGKNSNIPYTLTLQDPWW